MTEALHGSVVKAICKVQSSLDAVKKSQKNAHGGYMFASTDDIYAEIMRRMADAGLVILSLEDECEIQRVESTDRDGHLKVTQWARLVFSFVLATEEATWTDKRSKRTLFIQVTGPQTFQAAQSYAEKAFMRALFKLPTGDMDLDSIAQGDTEEDQAALNGKAKRKSSYAAKKDGETTALFNEIKNKIIEATGQRHLLQQIRTIYADEWNAMPAKWADLLNDEYDDALASCRDAAE